MCKVQPARLEDLDDTLEAQNAVERAIATSGRFGHLWGLTFDMSGGPKGAKRPLERPLDGGVRPHLPQINLALAPTEFLNWKASGRRELEGYRSIDRRLDLNLYGPDVLAGSSNKCTSVLQD